MLTIRSFTFSLVVVALLTGCPKKPDLTADAGAIVLTIDAGTPAVADAAVATDTTDTDAAAALPTTTTAAATTPHGCAAGTTAFIVDGKQTCEIECGQTKGKGNECTVPMVCIGKAPLAGAEAGAAPAEYCRTAPSGACPQTTMAQFWSTGGRPGCEVLCSKDNDPACTNGTTCKGNGQLFAVDGKMAQAHRYCRK